MSDVEFLNRIFNLDELPSTDSRCSNAADDIHLHRCTFSDWDDDWVFHDDRFGLMGCDDETLLMFLCETIHPELRRDAAEAERICRTYNK